MAEIGTDIEYAAKLLTEGKLVAIPTETVYGLAGNALNAKAIAEIYKVKKRPLSSPLAIQGNRVRKFKDLIQNVPESAKILAQNFWPGPLTLVLERTNSVLDILVNSGKTIGLRIPDHLITLELLSLVDFPLAVPSANLHGEQSPLTAKDVDDQLGDQIEYILEGGKCSVGFESTIVAFKGEEAIILRQGALSQEEIQETIEENT